jgi:hypothetical protein
VVESIGFKKGSSHLANAGESWLSCRNGQNPAMVRRGATFWRIETADRGFYQGAARVK